MPGCVGCGRAELGHKLCELCEGWYTTFSVEFYMFVFFFFFPVTKFLSSSNNPLENPKRPLKSLNVDVWMLPDGRTDWGAAVWNNSAD